MRRRIPPTRPRRLPIGAVAALLACLAVSTWALVTLLSAGGPSSATDLGPSTAGAGALSSDVPAPATGVGASPPQAASTSRGTQPPPVRPAVPRPATRPATLTDHLAAQQEYRAATPVRVLVQAVGIDSPVDAVGVAGEGQMEIPEEASRAGWYRFGPAPGQPGSAVLAGHVDDYLGRPGSLAALHEVEPGDEVVVVHEDGTRTSYLVRSRESVTKAELAVDRLFDREGEPRLVLVTCTGEWSEADGHYEENLVVTARLNDR